MKNVNDIARLAAKSETEETLMERIKFFLWWCAGADLTTLKLTPTDHTRFTTLGMMMVIVPCIATVSFTFFAIQTFGLSLVPAALAGVAWGWIVFVLDRLILTFHGKGRFEVGRAVPRFLLALSLAFLISEPLLVRMFHTEIELQLKRDAQTVVSDARKFAEARVASEKTALLNANSEMQTRLDGLKTLRDDKEAAVIGEIEGQMGSGIPGNGPAAERKREAFTEADAAYENAKTELQPQINKNKQRLADIQTAIDEEVKALEQSHKEAGGGMTTRHQALFAIIKREPGAAMTYVPLFLILALLEIAPLVNKLTFPAGEYDKQLALRQKNAIDNARRLAALERETQKGLIGVKRTLMGRVAGLVNGRPINGASQQELEVADLLRATVLDGFRREILALQTQSNGTKRFGPQMSIEVVNHPDLRVHLQLPAEGRAGITLAELDTDLRCIEAEIAEDSAQAISLVKATSSNGREVQRNLPLLPQLDVDQTLRLTFAPCGGEEAELPLA